jgi:hypothetical protein
MVWATLAREATVHIETLLLQHCTTGLMAYTTTSTDAPHSSEQSKRNQQQADATAAVALRYKVLI